MSHKSHRRAMYTEMNTKVKFLKNVDTHFPLFTFFASFFLFLPSFISFILFNYS